MVFKKECFRFNISIVTIEIFVYFPESGTYLLNCDNNPERLMLISSQPQISLTEIQEVLPEHHYHFVRTIGSGGFGSVFLVHSDKYSQCFCIKRIKLAESMSGETKNEAATLRRLCHPNNISMYEFFFNNARTNLYIVLEYCGGGSLRELIEKEGPIRPPKLYSYCYQIMKALLYCHDQSVAHRDIKPGNILLDNYGRPKLADFGLSKKVEKGKTTKDCAGSRPYMAPEILNCQNSDPFLADIWSLGITFYTMAFGRLPWIYRNNEELEMSIKTGIISFPSYADKEFCQLIRSMTSINPSKRESLSKLIRSPIFENIQKYNYSSVCPLRKASTENVLRRVFLTPTKSKTKIVRQRLIISLIFEETRNETRSCVTKDLCVVVIE